MISSAFAVSLCSDTQAYKMKICLLFIACCIAIFGCAKDYQQKETRTEEIVEKKPIVEHPLSIDYLRSNEFPGSDFEFADAVAHNQHYTKYIVSYLSDGNRLYAALAVPNRNDSTNTFPAIILNHGYISPNSYNNTKKYVRYIDFLAKNGFVVCMPDYRGHGKSEGIPTPPYFTNDYLTDVLNALSSVAKLEYVDTSRIALWGHSMGGTLTQQAMVVDTRIKAGVIWGGVVGTYEDIFYTFEEKVPWTRKGGYIMQKMKELEDEHGEFSLDNEFWKAISPIAHIREISGPIQLHHARYDPSVPVEFSIAFAQHMENAEVPVELYIYNSHDHNIGDPHFEQAMQRSVDFYKRILNIKK